MDRLQIAAQILPAIIPLWHDGSRDFTAEAARDALKYADALIKANEGTAPQKPAPGTAWNEHQKELAKQEAPEPVQPEAGPLKEETKNAILQFVNENRNLIRELLS